MKIVKETPGQKKSRKVVPISEKINPEDYRRAVIALRILAEKSSEEAKVKAFKALAAHNYVSFAAWARVWIQLNIVLESGEKSPFTPLARLAEKILKELRENDKRGRK